MKIGKKNKINLIGRREFVDFPELMLAHIEAKIDTGAYTSSIHCESISVVFENAKPVLYFTVEPNQKDAYRFEIFSQKKIKNSFGEMEERYVIKTLILLGGKKIRSTLSLSNRDNMRYPVLIGRKLIKGKFLIDVSHTHTGGIKIKNVAQFLNT